MAPKITAYRLIMYRKRAGLSQQGAAALLGVTPTQLMEWEKGKRMPSPKNLIKLEALYQRLISDLYAEVREEALQELAEARRRFGPDGLGWVKNQPP